jgi:hypothetical protein
MANHSLETTEGRSLITPKVIGCITPRWYSTDSQTG